LAGGFFVSLIEAQSRVAFLFVDGLAKSYGLMARAYAKEKH